MLLLFIYICLKYLLDFIEELLLNYSCNQQGFLGPLLFHSIAWGEFQMYKRVRKFQNHDALRVIFADRHGISREGYCTFAIMEAAKFTTLQMYRSLIWFITVDHQILPTMHHESELANSLIMADLWKNYYSKLIYCLCGKIGLC